MTIVKGLLLGAAAGVVSIAAAQAADLPSRKSAPVNFVKICDAYGAGFFYIPGTDTCLKVGGYARAQYDFTPGRNIWTVSAAGVPAIAQVPAALDTTGVDVTGRVDLDARTPTALGTVRTFIRLRATNASGIRNTGGPNGSFNNVAISLAPASATIIAIESALIQWAGFTFGQATSNYAFFPGYVTYIAGPVPGFRNGLKQLAYTATFGGGFSATLALEDRTDWGGAQATYNHTPANGFHLVANARVDQSWGYAIVHGMIGNNSLRQDFGFMGNPGILQSIAASNGTLSPLSGSATKMGFAIGATLKFNLPMLAAGDAIHFTANYADGLVGAIGLGNTINSIASPAQHRLLGGIQRADPGIIVTNGNCATNVGCTIGSVTGWGIATLLTHYWTPQFRSNFMAGYNQINPPTVAATAFQPFQWGKASVVTLSGSIIYSPVRDFDIGLELAYANMTNKVQNPSAAFLLAGSPGLKDSNFTLKLRVDRQF